MIPDDAWPAGDMTEWGDDETRTHHDFLNETTRPYTATENAAADAREVASSDEVNGSTLRAHAAAALAANRAFLALNAPTNAQTVAQVRAMARQVNGLIRLELGDLSGTD